MRRHVATPETGPENHCMKPPTSKMQAQVGHNPSSTNQCTEHPKALRLATPGNIKKQDDLIKGREAGNHQHASTKKY